MKKKIHELEEQIKALNAAKRKKTIVRSQKEKKILVFSF